MQQVKVIESNYNLAFQIREGLLSNEQVKRACSENASGEISFFVRNGQLQILSFKDSVDLISSGLIPEEQNIIIGMKEEAYRAFVSLFSNYIKKYNEQLNHLTIILNYHMNEDGSSLTKLTRDFLYETHYKRR